MQTTHLGRTGRVSVLARIIHYAACVLATGLVLLFLAFAIGEGPPPIGVGSAALLVMLVGFLLTWHHGLLGGVVSLMGISFFYMWNFADVGRFPGGWVFPLCFVPGVLLVLAWLPLRFGYVRMKAQE